MKTIKLVMMLAMIGGIFVACQNEDDLDNAETTAGVDSKISSKLEEMYFNTNDLEVIDFVLPDGTTQEMFQVEGDILFTRDQIKEMQMGGDITSKQYRTNNLVNTSGGVRTISIIGYTNFLYGLSSKEQEALRMAVENYNQLNLNIKFSLSFGTNYQSKDMVVYNNPFQFGSGGSAGFPTGGDPYKFVQIFGLNNFSTDVVEHVITHEMGHSVGFRHTDWFSRQSCGQNSNEGEGDVGAVHIPGTPTGYDSTSIMLSCFSSNTNGEFNANDKTALNYLY